MTLSALTNERSSEDDFEAVYERYSELLAQIAVVKFRVPECEAGALVHDVLLSYLVKSGDIADLRRWLIGAICHASRHYWRLNRRTTTVDAPAVRDRADPSTLRISDTLHDSIAVRELLAILRPRYREILCMRYLEGCTVAEVALRLGVKTKYAQKLIAKCLRRAETLYARKGRGR
jgi:RNA polymerase sigma factor (sigma-70 family)